MSASKIRCFFVVFGLVYILESIGGFYMTSAIVFIERQFQIPSRLSGTMVSAGDFAYIPVVIFTSYFGGKGNRAQWIGAGCMLIAIANLLIASSNFLFPVHDFSLDLTNVSLAIFARVRSIAEGELTCARQMASASAGRMANVSGPVSDAHSVHTLNNLPYAFCDYDFNLLRRAEVAGECEANPASIGPFVMIFSGLLILGIGRTMPFSLGLPLMDDNVKKHNLPVYFAIMFFAKILGPVIGLLIGGQLNKVYFNFKPPLGLTPRDPMWIGCWWLGFLIFGSLLFFPSLALFCFPADSVDEEEEDGIEMTPVKPAKKNVRLNLVDKHKQKTDKTVSTKDELLAFVETMKILFRSPIYMGSMVGRVIDVLAFKGFYVFLAKYLQLQFDVPQHQIQQYLALIGIMGFACGVAAGSGIMKVFKLQGRKAAAWVAICSLVAALNSYANALVGCTSVSHRIGQQGLTSNFTFSACDPSCSCEGAPLFPVCNSNGEPFYSPCHAGCPLSGKNFTLFITGQAADKSNPLFRDCKCAGTLDAEVSSGFCERETCESRFTLFFIVQAIGACFGGMAVVPGMLIILRSVPPEHRSVSLGFNGFVVSLFATLPSPMLWGLIFDLSCLHWAKVCKGATGACQLYDTEQLRLRIFAIYGTMRVVSLLSDVWVVYWAKGLKITEEEEKEVNGIEEKKTRRQSRHSIHSIKLAEEEALMPTVAH